MTDAMTDATQETRGSFRLGYRPALDGIRAVAIVAVMAFHAGWPHGGGGYLGVDVFFALSGFLITTLLVEERRRRDGVDLAAFWARRALRLLPALVALLVVAAGYVALRPHAAISVGFRTDALAAALYVANWAQALASTYHVRLLSHTWSLGIEEQFYVLWPPLLAFLLLRTRPRIVVAVTAALAAASVVARAVLFHLDGFSPRVSYGLDTRASALLLGCLLALVVTRLPAVPRPAVRRAAALSGVAGVVVLAWMVAGPRYTSAAIGAHPSRVFHEAYLFAPLATCALIVGVVVAPASVVALVLSRRPFVALGRISYGVYLWHYPVDLVLAPRAGHHASPGLQVARALVGIGLAAVSYVVVERPFLRIKSRLAARRRDPVTAAAVLPAAGT